MRALIQKLSSGCIIAASAIVLSAAPALSQPPGGMPPDQAMMPEVAPTSVTPDTAPAASSVQVELPANVIEVMSPTGELLAPFEQAQHCIEGDCQVAIVNLDTGEIASFGGVWQSGYLETLDGEQVVRVVDLNAPNH